MDKMNVRFEVRPEDTLEKLYIDLQEHIRQAVAKATAEGIKANSIVLNSNLVKVPEVFGMNPPMICGLRAYVTTVELPDGYAFSVQDDRMDSKPVTNGDRIRAMSDEDLAVEIMCPYGMEEGMCTKPSDCLSCCLEWLRQPVQPTATADEDPHEHSGLVEE